MKRLLACFGFVAILAMPALAFQPWGWVYNNFPWAYDAASGDWYWFNTDDRQWVANMSNGQWARLDNSALSAGWSYHVWPWAYAQSNGAWHWFNQSDRQWVVNMRSGTWSRFGQPQWEPGRSIGPVQLGDTYAAVVAKMGMPDEVREDAEPNGDIIYWIDYDATGLILAIPDTNGDEILNANEVVADLFAFGQAGSSPQWTYRGITFGSSRAAAVAILGPPSIDDPESPWWWSRGTMLHFGNDGLDQICLFPIARIAR